MTNKQKARELAIKSTRDIDDKGNEVYNSLVEAALQEMAKWKEQQMVERAIGWIDYNNRNGGCWFDGWEYYFKKAMKGEQNDE